MLERDSTRGTEFHGAIMSCVERSFPQEEGSHVFFAGRGCPVKRHIYGSSASCLTASLSPPQDSAYRNQLFDLQLQQLICSEIASAHNIP